MNFRYLSILCLFGLFLVGCGQNNDDTSLPNEEQPNHLQNIQVKNSNPQQNDNLDFQEIATHLANIASDVPNVNGATAIVLGTYAVVGIDVEEELDRSRVGTIKYSVSEALY